MKMKYAGWTAVVAAAMMLVGCGSDSKVDGGAGRTGEATISIAPYGSPVLSETGSCAQYFVVHGIDDHGNPIPNLHVTSRLIVQPTVIGQNTGVISVGNNAVELTDPTKNFNALQVMRENNLIVLPTPARSHPSYVGDWWIYSVNGDTLVLGDKAYNLNATDQLSYAIGDERAYVNGALFVAHIDNLDSNGTVATEDGYTYFAVVYDDSLGANYIPYAVGAHIEGYRVGNAYQGHFVSCMEAPETNSTSSGTTCSGGSTCPLAK